MSVEVTRVEVGDGVVHRLQFTRPEARNALDTPTLEALVDALADADADPDLVGVLLTGAAGHFSAGADLREGSGAAPPRRRRELFVLAYEQVAALRAPSAAAVEGYAVGGGAELAIGCDLVVVARSARLRFPGALHGVPVGVARTVGRVGLGTARDWVLSSRFVDASEAHASGLAQRLCEDGLAEATAMGWLEQVASRDRATVEHLKRLFAELGGERDRVARENDGLRAQAELGRLPSYDEGLPRTVRPRRGRV